MPRSGRLLSLSMTSEAFGSPGVEMGEEGRSQMAARGGTHDAHPLRIDAPFGRPGPHQTDGPRRVLEHYRVPVTGRTEAVLEHESGYPVPGQESGVIGAFMIGQTRV
jgi:hypothetical protein